MPTQRRVALVDFSHPALYSPTYFLIPAAKSSVNLLAIALPYQTPVMIVFHILNILAFLPNAYLKKKGLDWNSLGNARCSHRSVLFKSRYSK